MQSKAIRQVLAVGFFLPPGVCILQEEAEESTAALVLISLRSLCAFHAEI